MEGSSLANSGATVEGKYVRLLGSVPAFAGWAHRELASVARLCTKRSAKPQQALYWQNEPCGAFFVLLEGSVKLIRRNATHREKVIRVVVPGESFGEVAVFSGSGYPNTAVALEDSELLSIQAVPFARFLYRKGECAWGMLTVLSRRVDALMQEVERLSTYNAEQRVAAHLLDRHERCNGHDTSLAAFGKSRAELASLLSITPETLSRMLSRFQQRGWISTGDGIIHVNDPESLSRLLP